MAPNASPVPAAPAQPAPAADPAANYQGFVDRITTQVIAAMPISVPDADLRRARARFRVAFSPEAQAALRECTPDSVARAIVLSAMSGLFPGGPRPDVWLIPRRNKHNGNRMEANWQMSFRGYIRLARRAGWELEPVNVFEGEKFEIIEGTEPSLLHVRNLELPKNWASLRYAYIRVYPTGKRNEARIAYLTKAEINQRRQKAKDQTIWNEWPLEMVYKTMCHYAGNREMFPTDDPARYAMESEEQAEIGGGAAHSQLWGATEGALPAGAKTASLAAQLGAAPADSGAVIEVSGRPLDFVPEGGAESGAPTFTPLSSQPGEMLSTSQVSAIRAEAARLGASIDELENAFGAPLEEITIPGQSAASLETTLRGEIASMAEDAARERAKGPGESGQAGLPLTGKK